MRILIALLFLVTLSASAQDAGPSKTRLAAKTLMAYEAKSEAKVAEFYNYLELLTDPKLDAEMKTRVTAQAKKLFSEGNISVADVFSKKPALVSLNSLLENAASQKQKHSFTVTGFKTARLRSAEGHWQLRYTIITKSGALQIEQGYFLEEISKDFGTQTQVVTTAYLGDVKLAQ